MMNVIGALLAVNAFPIHENRLRRGDIDCPRAGRRLAVRPALEGTLVLGIVLTGAVAADTGEPAEQGLGISEP